MISTEELSGLLSFLYAAPLEPEQWQHFMARLCSLLGICCGYLIVKDHDANSSTLLAGGGPNFVPQMFSLYDQYYAVQDPYTRTMLTSPCTGYFEGDALYDRTMLVKSEIYNDFLRSYELESTNVLMAGCTHNQLEGISLWRAPKQLPLDGDARKLLLSLLPHLQMALRLRAQMMLQDTARLFTETALDRLAIAAFLVTGNGRVLHMNNKAAAFLAKKDGLILRCGLLVTGSLTETAQLTQLLNAATSARRAITPGGAMRVRQSSTGGYLYLTAISAPKENQIAGNDRYAVVFVSDPAEKPASRGNLMRQLYGLTPTESRLADLLLQGLDMEQIAEEMFITVGTARCHLKRVLAKTGTRRQAELTRLMLTLPG